MVASEAALSINLLHMNDIPSHFDQVDTKRYVVKNIFILKVNVNTGRCHTEQAEVGDCFGGMARMFTAIRFFLFLCLLESFRG